MKNLLWVRVARAIAVFFVIYPIMGVGSGNASWTNTSVLDTPTNFTISFTSNDSDPGPFNYNGTNWQVGFTLSYSNTVLFAMHKVAPHPGEDSSHSFNQYAIVTPLSGPPFGDEHILYDWDGQESHNVSPYGDQSHLDTWSGHVDSTTGVGTGYHFGTIAISHAAVPELPVNGVLFAGIVLMPLLWYRYRKNRVTV